MNILRIFLLCLILSSAVSAGETILDDYLQYGLENNLAMKKQTLSLQQSMAVLKEARGMFLPSVNIEARYSRAGGGRIIEFPVGDFMNPVYSTLNELLASVGQPAPFPESIPNEVIPFLREEEHDTKIRIIQPLFQPAILYNYLIKKNQRDMGIYERNMYGRQLVADIQTAYFNVLKAEEIVTLLNETEKLVQENVRVSEALFENQKVTQAVIYRAQSELQALKQQQAESEKNKIMATAYFNFLLNRPLDASVERMGQIKVQKTVFMTFEEAAATAQKNREEIKQLEKAVSLMGHKMNLSRTAFLPGVTAVLDYGFEGEKYSFTRKDDYWMASIVAQWNLFNGFQDKYKVDQAKLDKKMMQNQLEEANHQIALQVQNARQTLIVSQKSIEAAEKRLQSARKSFRIIDRKFKEGMASQIEYIDARNSMTQAEVNHIVTVYDWYHHQAEWEKVLAIYPLDLENP